MSDEDLLEIVSCYIIDEFYNKIYKSVCNKNIHSHEKIQVDYVNTLNIYITRIKDTEFYDSWFSKLTTYYNVHTNNKFNFNINSLNLLFAKFVTAEKNQKQLSTSRDLCKKITNKFMINSITLIGQFMTNESEIKKIIWHRSASVIEEFKLKAKAALNTVRFRNMNEGLHTHNSLSLTHEAIEIQKLHDECDHYKKTIEKLERKLKEYEDEVDELNDNYDQIEKELDKMHQKEADYIKLVTLLRSDKRVKDTTYNVEEESKKSSYVKPIKKFKPNKSKKVESESERESESESSESSESESESDDETESEKDDDLNLKSDWKGKDFSIKDLTNDEPVKEFDLSKKVIEKLPVYKKPISRENFIIED